MKRNLIRSVALISMLSLCTSSAVANQDSTQESVLDCGAVQLQQLRAFINDNWEQVLNYGLPVVLTVAVAAIKFWPTAKAEVAVATPEAKAEQRKSSRSRTPKKKSE
jgi:hypothetical protein